MNKPKDLGNEVSPELQAAAANAEPTKIEPKATEKMSDEDIQKALKAMETPPAGEADADESGNEEIDGDDDGGAEADAAADPDGAATGDADEGDGKGVPTSRFNEAVGKERSRADQAEDRALELQRQIDMLRQGIDPNAPKQLSPEEAIQALEDDLDAKREAYEDAIADGDKTARAAARAAIRAAESALRQESLNQVESRARNSTKQDLGFDNALSQLETAFPEINPDSNQFDGALSDKLVNLLEGHMRGGMSRVEALQEAAEVYLMPRKKDSTAANLRETGKKATISAAKAAAPDLSSVGSGKADVAPTLKPSRMTPKQYADLPEDVKARLRGDNPVEEHTA